MKKTKTKVVVKKPSLASLLGLVFLLIISFYPYRAIWGVDYYSMCDNYEGEEKKQCEKKADKAETYEKLIKLKSRQQNFLSGQIDEINRQQSQILGDLSEAKDKVALLDQQIKELENKISDQKTAFEYNKKVISNLLLGYYDFDKMGISNIIIAEEDFAGVLSEGDRLGQFSVKIGDILSDIKEIKDALVRNQEELQSKRDEVGRAKEELESKNLDLQSSENQKQKLLGQTQAEKLKYEKLLADVEDEISAIDESLSGSVDYSKLPADKDGYFTWPVNPHNITQSYGKTKFAKSSGAYKNNFHNGIDFGIKYSSVFAAKGGKVVGSGDNGRYAYGRWLAIEHGDGLTTLYGHLSAKSVSKGDSVKEGQKIGVSGNTGFSTGPHLHFSVFSSSSFKTVESKYVNGLMIPTGGSVSPLKYL